MGQIKSILLVDDSEATNFFNKTIITRSDCAEQVIIAKNGEEALASILTGLAPELIFLDINMPVMNGWEFLKAYQKLNQNHQNSMIVLMIGTPLLDVDKLNYEGLSFVKEFNGKMLSKEVIQKFIELYKDPNSILV